MMIYSRLNDMCRVMPYCQGILWCSVQGKSLWWSLLLVRGKSWNIKFHAINMRGRTIWAHPTWTCFAKWNAYLWGQHLHNIDELLTDLWRCICVCRFWCRKLQHGNWLAIMFIRLKMLTTCRYVNLIMSPMTHTKNYYNLWETLGRKINMWRQMSTLNEW
jgi:hypothetical protein